VARGKKPSRGLHLAVTKQKKQISNGTGCAIRGDVLGRGSGSAPTAQRLRKPERAALPRRQGGRKTEGNVKRNGCHHLGGGEKGRRRNEETVCVCKAGRKDRGKEKEHDPRDPRLQRKDPLHKKKAFTRWHIDKRRQREHTKNFSWDNFSTKT